ncbi:MAG: hypothetical protein NTW21_29745 [Verrucomicrobia bacterium]|nr:hypothetical protein [Verrucomicrobiota bacterium]
MQTTSDSSHFSLRLACVLGCCWLVAPTAAPETPPRKVGFVRIVNALAQGQDRLQLLIDGEVMNADGYQLGDVTGGIGLTPGAHQITLKRVGVRDGVTRIALVADNTVTLIPFAERVPASDDQAAHWAMRILRLKQLDPETKRTATFVSVSQTPEHEVEIRAPNGKWTKVFVKRLTLARTPIHYPEGYVPLRCKSGKLPSIPVGEPGNYVVVLYDDAEGKLQALNLQDYKYLSAD